MFGKQEKKLPDRPENKAALKTDNQTGLLVAVVGPSGSGKDSLINAAREHLKKYEKIIFPKRLITRQDQVGEDHIPISIEEFKALELQNAFFISWDAHNLHYAISLDVKESLEAGSTIILNLSRRTIGQVKENWPNTIVVNIKVDKEILLERLISRGREDSNAIKARLERQVDMPASQADYIIDNSGSLEHSANNFIEIIKSNSLNKFT